MGESPVTVGFGRASSTSLLAPPRLRKPCRFSASTKMPACARVAQNRRAQPCTPPEETPRSAQRRSIAEPATAATEASKFEGGETEHVFGPLWK